MATQKLTTIGSFVVLAMWSISCLDGILTGQFEALQIVTPVMLILAGYLFARDFFVRNEQSKQKPKEKS